MAPKYRVFNSRRSRGLCASTPTNNDIGCGPLLLVLRLEHSWVLCVYSWREFRSAWGCLLWWRCWGESLVAAGSGTCRTGPVGAIGLMACVLCHVWPLRFRHCRHRVEVRIGVIEPPPTVQGEFKAWTERINRLGFDLEQRDLEESLWTVAKGVMRTRKDALYPFHRYYRNAGTWQSWRMFVAPHRYPSRLHIDIKQDGEWNSAYVARSPTLNWKV